MLRAGWVQPQRQEDITDRQAACSCIVICLLIYFLILMLIGNSLWYSYAESSCFVVNSTVFERQRCLIYESESVFDAVWIVDVHQQNELHSIQYSADIQQEFDYYYEAYEAISTFHPVCIDSCQFNFLMCSFLDWF
jgi:hypothetical protein